MLKKKKLNPALQIVLGFLTVILIGAFLLSLPISNINGDWFNFVDSFFTSTSAVCVTGLTVVDIMMQFTLFGQIVLLVLIQIGGLGFITLTTLLFLIIGKKITLKDRLAIKESLNQDDTAGVVKLVKKIVIFVFITEFIGALCLLPSFVNVYGWGQGIFKSIFVAISAFCNAGFDNLGTGGTSFASLGAFANDVFVLLPIMLLIIIGGLGFFVLFDLPNIFKKKKLAFHTKVVLIATSILIFGGAILFAIFEWNNPSTLGNLPFGQKIIHCLFYSITPRTAGFSIGNLADLSSSSLILTNILMFIGGSPASTAGGIKTTTFFVLLLLLFKKQNNNGSIVIKNKTISQKLINKAFKIFGLALAIIITSTMVICAIENLAFDVVLFEVISAISTVGLSINLTPLLCAVSKIIIAILMFAGRVGTLTLTIAISGNSSTSTQEIEYPDSKLVIG